ncbi:desumoylating isopeptidase 1 [Asparagus officinalis]|nr:desumoylating isopeptidase 1 [Asparagus officinalis]
MGEVRDMGEDGHRVTLNMYDLSQGLARQFSTSLLGKAIEAIWHTGVVVYGNEYYFGGGIQHNPAGRTPYGTPMRVIDLGVTHVPKEVFEEYLQEISSRYTAETYKLLSHNCNNFSNEVAHFLVGTSIPEYILQLPNEVLNSPMGALILPMIQSLEATVRTGAVPQAPQFVNPLAAATQPSHPRSSFASLRSASTDQAKAQAPQPGPDTATNPIAGREKEAVVDPMGDARSIVQEEITKEFAAIMASGTLRASEAAALATRRVMEKHGRLNSSMN